MTTSDEPTDGRSEVDAGDVHGWVRNGPDDAPRVLLLHGGPGLGMEYLEPLVTELGAVTLACFQQRGLAPSTTSGPWDLDTAIADVERFLDALGWESATLLGHSWGAHLALQAAVRISDRVDALLLVEALGAVGDGGQELFVTELMARTPAEAAVRLQEIGTSSDPADQDEVLELMWPAYFADPDEAPPYPGLRVCNEANEELMEAVEAEIADLEAKLGTIDLPLGIVMGARSPMPLTAGSDVAMAVDGAWLAGVPDAGHFLWLEAPGTVATALERVLTARA